MPQVRLSEMRLSLSSLLPLLGLLVLVLVLVLSPPRTNDSFDSSTSTVCLRLLNTRRFDESCHGSSSVYPLLITGLGGSGTHAIARWLRERGLDLEHERIASLGAVAWMYAVNDKVVGSPYPFRAVLRDASVFSPRFRRVVHVVRCPWDQISSLTSHTKLTFDFIFSSMLSFNLTPSDMSLVVHNIGSTYPRIN